MKTKSLFKPLLLLFVCVNLLSSCSSDSSSSGGDVTQLFDKWWYDTNDFTADVYFNSNGTYQQYLNFAGAGFSNTGTWTWENESQKIMKVSYETGPNAVTEVLFKFSNIQENSFTVKQSVDDGATYSQPVNYSDTDE